MKPLTYGSGSSVDPEQVDSTSLRGVFAIANQPTLPVTYGTLASFICEGAGWTWGMQLMGGVTAGVTKLHYRYGQGNSLSSYEWGDWHEIQLA